MATQRGGLGLGQRLLLLAAWTVSCGFVYVLGFYVGKGVRGGHADFVPRVALPVEAPEPAEPPRDEQAPLTFYDVLGAPGSHGPVEPGGAPARVAAPAPDAPPAPVALRDAATAPAAAPAPPALAEAEAHRAPEPAAPGAPAAAVPPAPSRAVPHAEPPAHEGASAPAAPAPEARRVAAAPKPAAAEVPPATTQQPVPSGLLPPPPAPTAPDGRWVVYANPTRDRLAAEHERATLRALGYPAEVVMLRRDRDVWYRVRVGRYATQALAEQASRQVRGEGAGQAFVQSE